MAFLAAGVLSACFSTGGSLLIWLVGIPIIALGLELSRVFARVERWRMRLVDPRPLVPHAVPAPERHAPRPRTARGSGRGRRPSSSTPTGGATWSTCSILLPLAILEFMVAIVLWVAAGVLILAPIAFLALRAAGVTGIRSAPPSEWALPVAAAVIFGLLLVPVSASVSRGLIVLHRAVVQGLLCVDPAVALRQDVERLRGSRSAALELEASELRRIERDLHDGAQQRLVSLAIDLGRAEERIDTDPVAAKAIVVEARAQARLALAELRDLVRGTMPAILVDRGLEAALASVAAGCPVPTTLDSGLAPGERLPAAVERAAYFVVVEALANVAKHSAARRCEIALRRDAVLRSSSRSGTTAPAARRWLPAAASRGSGTGRRRSTGRCAHEPGRRSDRRARGAAARREYRARRWPSQPPIARGLRRPPVGRRGRRSLVARLGRRPGGRRLPVRVEVGEDRQDPAVVVLRVGEVELAEDARDVLLRRALADHERGRDPDVRLPLGHRPEDLPLARGQGRQPVVAPPLDHDLGDDLGIEGGPACRPPAGGRP